MILAALTIAGILAASLVPQTPARGIVVSAGGGGTLSHVDSSNSPWLGGSGTSKTITNTVASGNLLSLGIGWGNTTTITGLSDDKGNTWTQVGTALVDSGTLAIYYATNTASGATIITVTFSADPGFGNMIVHEIAGASTGGPLDQEGKNSQFNPGTGANAITSGSETTTVNGEYIFGYTMDVSGVGGTESAGTGFTGLVTSGDGASEYQIQSSSGSVAATFTSTGTFQVQLTGIATFK